MHGSGRFAMSQDSDWKNIPYGWIRFLYVCTALMGISTGLIILLAPDRFSRKVIGVLHTLPDQDRIIFGLVGSFWLAMGIMAVLGLRAPLRFLPIFLIQLVYKTFWYLCVFAPLIIAGNFPVHGWAMAAVNAVWMFMDLKAIPFAYLLSRDSPVGLPGNDTGR
jgi:hypothetical protein